MFLELSAQPFVLVADAFDLLRLAITRILRWRAALRSRLALSLHSESVRNPYAKYKYKIVPSLRGPELLPSGVTGWGEHLLESVPLPPIRRLDVAKAFVGLFSTVLLSAATFPFLPEATKYAMDALKRSIHNCYFTHNGKPAPLADEVAYFEGLSGTRAAFAELLVLRGEYRRSLRFVGRCLLAIVDLHLRTAVNLSFPRAARVRGMRQRLNGDPS